MQPTLFECVACGAARRVAVVVLVAITYLCSDMPRAGADETARKFGKFTRTEVQFLVGDRFKLGSEAPDTNARATVTVDHFTKFDGGDLFFFVDVARELDGAKNNSIYGEVYAALDVSKLLDQGADQWSWNLSAVLGTNLGRNVGFLLPGARLNLKVPGFDLFSLYALAYETIRGPTGRDFDTTYQGTFVWSMPLAYDGDVKLLAFKGFLDVRGGRTDAQSHTIIAQPQLRLDIGHFFGNPNKIHLGTELGIIRNKFNNKGVHEFAPQLLLVVQL